MASQSKILIWCCDIAGFAGLAATIVLCSLAYDGQTGWGFWSAVAVALAGCSLYLAQVIAARATGHTAFTWREMILATIVPIAAVVVSLIIAGQAAGLYRLPFGPEQPTSPPVIHLNPSGDSSA